MTRPWFVPLMLTLLLSFFPWAAAPPPAQAVSCVGAGDVTSLSDCGLGPLTFSDFAVSAQGSISSAAVFISDTPFTFTDGVSQAVLGLQVANPTGAVNGLGDVLLAYKVSSADPTLLQLGVNLGNGGINVTVNERVCGSAFVLSTCQTGLLANLTAGPNELQSVFFDFPVAGELYILKDMIFSGTAENFAFLSDLSNSHEFSTNPGGGEIAPTPEPGTLFLLGSSLVMAGVALRRRGFWSQK